VPASDQPEMAQSGRPAGDGYLVNPWHAQRIPL